MNKTDLPQLTAGKKYLIETRYGRQVKIRWSIMRYLGENALNPQALSFDARPVAGTQSVLYSDIIDIREVHDSAEIKINKIKG